jgi:trimeric autotransporter adhesin
MRPAPSLRPFRAIIPAGFCAALLAAALPQAALGQATCGSGSVADATDATTQTVCGTGAYAHGDNSTAVGSGAGAANGYQVGGAANQAFGAGAGQNVYGSYNLAAGFNAGGRVTGDNNVAIGPNSGNGILGDSNVAIGDGAGNAPGVSNISIGTAATAVSMADAIAIGDHATANGTNSIAIGTGVTATGNQVAIGNNTNTYTLAGITSAASKNVQSGPVEYVTADASGNLATASNLTVGTPVLPTDAANKAYVDAELGAANQRIDRANQGIAIAMSVQNPVLTPGDRFGVALNFSDFAGYNALGAAAVGIVAKDVFGKGDKLGLIGGAGVSSSQTAGRVGMQLTW